MAGGVGMGTGAILRHAHLPRGMYKLRDSIQMGQEVWYSVHYAMFVKVRACGTVQSIDWINNFVKYARILLFQFVFTKYVIGFRNYDGFIFVLIDVIFQNVIMRMYDKIRF